MNVRVMRCHPNPISSAGSRSTCFTLSASSKNALSGRQSPASLRISVTRSSSDAATAELAISEATAYASLSGTVIERARCYRDRPTLARRGDVVETELVPLRIAPHGRLPGIGTGTRWNVAACLGDHKGRDGVGHLGQRRAVEDRSQRHVSPQFILDERDQ